MVFASGCAIISGTETQTAENAPPPGDRPASLDDLKDLLPKE
jgi:hypothetical protein